MLNSPDCHGMARVQRNSPGDHGSANGESCSGITAGVMFETDAAPPSSKARCWKSLGDGVAVPTQYRESPARTRRPISGQFAPGRGFRDARIDSAVSLDY